MSFEKRPSKKSKSGYTWRVRFTYIDQYGIKQEYKKSGFATKAQAQEHGKAMEEELKRTGGARPKKYTLGMAWDEWYKVKSHSLSVGTLSVYKTKWDKYLKPYENRELKTFTIGELQDFFDAHNDLSKSAQNNIKTILLNCFKMAKKQGWITFNPMHDIELHGKEKKEQAQTLTLDQINQAIDVLQTYHIKENRKMGMALFLYIGYYTGLRLGEILALEWQDIDFDSMTINVCKKMEFSDGKPYITDKMKTKSSKAVLPLCEPLANILKPYKGDKNNSVTNLYSIRFREPLKNAFKAIGVDNFHPHMLRHTFITELIRKGVDPKTASQLARHSDISTTMNIYTNMNFDDLSQAMDKVYKECPKNVPIPVNILS